MVDNIFGLTWKEIEARQQKNYVSVKVDMTKPGDYGSDPLGDGNFRMIPSGEIVDFAERNRRLSK